MKVKFKNVSFFGYSNVFEKIKIDLLIIFKMTKQTILLYDFKGRKFY